MVSSAGPEVSVAFLLLTLWLGLALAAVGALLLALRRGELLGPVLWVAGVSLTLEYVLRVYAYLGLRVHPGSLPLAATAGWAGFVVEPFFFPASLVLILLLFPGGRPHSRPWRVVAAAVLVVTAGRVLLLAVRPGPLVDESFHYEIPWHGVMPAAARPALAAVEGGADTLLVLMVIVAGVGLIARFRASSGTVRQQFKPLALVAGLAVAGLVTQIVAPGSGLGSILLVSAVTIGLPAALAVAVLRYRLWDLDRLVVAAIVYGALAVLVTGVYVAVVVGLAAFAGAAAPTGSLGPSILATAAVALVFGPARERLARAARRLVYGVRATPYEALVSLPRRLAEGPEIDEVLPAIAQALGQGLGVPAARVRAFLDDGTHEAAWSPPDAATDGPGLLVVEVRHLGQVVGDVAVLSSPDRPLGRSERRLLFDLAMQAGPAIRGVGLAAQLRAHLTEIRAQAAQLAASRERIAAAQVDERRRLERDIHDGAQQQLVALAVRLQAAEDLVASGDPRAVAAVRRCHEDVDRCIGELRELARGIYPPVLSARGLVPALRARARVAPGRVRVDASPRAQETRFPAGVEVAVYFCCLEAMQNAAKHAPGADVLVRLDLADGLLEFEVSDTGSGFTLEPGAGHDGTGLLGMQDRLAAVGGALSVTSAPGEGTAVRGRVPVGGRVPEPAGAPA